MQNVAIQFEAEGFYVPLRRVGPLVIDPLDLLELDQSLARTRQDWFVLAALLALVVWVVGFDLAFTISHWGRL